MNDLGNLSNCVVDAEANACRARGLRWQAFVGSVFLQAAVVGGLLLWPLITPGVLSPRLTATPLPPYSEESARGVVRQSDYSARPTFTAITRPLLLAHPNLGHAPTPSRSEPPGFGVGPIEVGPAERPLIPGASGNGHPVEIPRPQADRSPVKMSEGLMAARLIRRVQPLYPKLAITMRLSGTVELQARIGTDGTVRQLEVVSGNPILARAAVEAVQQWLYEPTRLDGQAVEVQTNITVTFSLQ